MEVNTKVIDYEEPSSSEILLKKSKTKALKAYNKLDDIGYKAVKRSFDIAWGLAGCVALAVITPVVKIATMASGDFKPIFYTQKRVGKDGKIIKIFKFRSMCPDADIVLDQILRESPELAKEWHENQKLKNDPRITKIGNVLRKTSIDEIPQFLNVLKGDMSLIGPRPLVEGELDAHGGDHKRYEAMRPGITGWWGCNGRNDTTYQERLNLEYYYVDNASVVLDARCILKTIEAVVKKTGVQ
ncbi:MAG: sugar transferase [Clostridia bacterium]|nr:sugar transferase [Clostridia bacterium]